MQKPPEYIRLILSIPEDQHDVVIALLAEAGYEGFVQETERLEAFVVDTAFDAATLRQAVAPLGLSDEAWRTEVISPRNWNAEWEAGFAPVEVEDFCQILASFHEPKPGFKHTLYIDPKMSFGTGHHETTRLMVRQLRYLAEIGLVKGTRVLDMGSGTGVLGLLAAKLKAASVLGVDIDPLSDENARENQQRNDLAGGNVEFQLGDATSIPAKKFDLILANINRNVLVQDVATYARHLAPVGRLICSGYYLRDTDVITSAFAQQGLRPLRRIDENEWASHIFAR